jgi:3-oxoadipate enol-lactonase
VQTIFVGPAPRLALSVAGEGELVLFLHGIGGRRQNWDAQLAFFSAHYKAAAWDARGYGESDDYDGPLDFAVFSQDVLRVLDHFGAQKAHLVGLSMGGRIARNFALRHPPAQAKRLLGPDAPPAAYEKLVASLSAVHRESYLKTVEASVAQDLAAPIDNIAVPTLVITSTHDSLYPLRVAEDMARRIPGARLAVIERAGHLSNLERPDEFNRIVLEFLRLE